MNDEDEHLKGNDSAEAEVAGCMLVVALLIVALWFLGGYHIVKQPTECQLHGCYKGDEG